MFVVEIIHSFVLPVIAVVVEDSAVWQKEAAEDLRNEDRHQEGLFQIESQSEEFCGNMNYYWATQNVQKLGLLCREKVMKMYQ